jgi:serine/threonine-protein kinase
MLVGARLYEGEDVANAILNDPPPDVGEVRGDLPPDLVALTFELLAKDRAERPEDAALVASRLETILREVLAAREPIDLRTFVRVTAAEQREEQRALLATAEDQEANGPSPAPPAVDAFGETVAATPSGRSRTTASRALPFALTLAIVVALGGIGWLLLAPPGGNGSGEAGTGAAAPPDEAAEEPPARNSTVERSVRSELAGAPAAMDVREPVPSSEGTAAAAVAEELRESSSNARASKRVGRRRAATRAPPAEPPASPVTEAPAGIPEMPWPESPPARDDGTAPSP